MRRHRLIFLAVALAGLTFVAAVLGTVRPDITGLFGGGQCRLAGRVAAAVEPHAEGTMAAFEPLQPVDVSALPYDGRGEDAARLAEREGTLTLMNLWATWCAPCRAEMPSLAALSEAMSGPAFEVLAVSIDNRDANRPEEFLPKTGADSLDYHREPTLTLFNSLRNAGLALGMPTTLLIAPDGCAAGVLHGAAAWDSAGARALITAAMEALE